MTTAGEAGKTADESSGSRYLIGIDLGTTNSAVGYVDTFEDDWQIHSFPIAQLVAPGEIEKRPTLPSFHYEPADAEGSLDLPWSTTAETVAVGTFARDFGRSVPGRMVESAKSWLCHSGVDRRAALLPWHGSPDVEALSPVEASARYLKHIRQAWDHDHPDDPLAEQDVVLTIPASFDEVARELTVTAARTAGIPRVVLIEEPQAAFYNWVHAHRGDWEQHVEAGQRILVCDIGGGTTDFTLINVRPGEDDHVQFHRVAVGDHLMLGGDNLDLALACHVEQRLMGDGKLTPRQWSVLVPACRHAKETLLTENAPEELTITLPGSGSKLIGGGTQVTVSRNEVVELLTEGFLPRVKLTDRPETRQSGFQEFGLPYAPDAAITRYLAAFLQAHQSEGSDSDAHPARPDIILLNGGFFASSVLRNRLMDVLQTWFRANDSSDNEAWSPQVLQNDRLDLAVAHGAAFFGMVRRGFGVRIVAGLARTYYVGVQNEAGEDAALCLVPAGTESGTAPIEIDRDFQVYTSEPAEFPIYYSGTRLTDEPGTIVPIDDETLTSLPPIRTVLQTRGKDAGATVTARLTSRITEIGTLELWCHQTDGSRRWQLQFDVRSSTETDRGAHTGTAEQSGIVDEETARTATSVLRSVFGPDGQEKPAGLPKRIAREISMSRSDWPPSLLRNMWGELMDLQDGRRRSAKYEARWLNLVGFCLRPGFGMAADDWRVEQTWKTVRGQLLHNAPDCLTEWRILCRRIAGGLTAGRQRELSSAVLSSLRQKHRQMKTGRGRGADYAGTTHEAAEVWRMLGSLELLDRSLRLELGRMILDFLPRPSFEPLRPALIWTLGRLGTRVPVYGPLNVVIAPDIAADWIEKLTDEADLSDPVTQLACMQLARRTDDRYRDIDGSTRDRLLRELEQASCPDTYRSLIREGGTLDTESAHQILGESLPTGLRIR